MVTQLPDLRPKDEICPAHEDAAPVLKRNRAPGKRTRPSGPPLGYVPVRSVDVWCSACGERLTIVD